jgi:mTERF domain-containing protein
MGYSVSECRKLLLKHPRLLSAGVQTGLIPRLKFLHREVEISIEDLRVIVQKNPRILEMSVDQNLQPKLIFFFILTLRMQPKEVSKMLVKFPQILDFNLDNHISPIYRYFLSLNLSTYEFSRILQRAPNVISLSLPRIKQRIEYLKFELNLEADAIRRILHQSPQIISLSQENLETSIQFLLDTVAPGTSLTTVITEKDDKTDEHDGVGTRTSDSRNPLGIVQTIITGLPSILNLSIERNLQPKVEYLGDRLGEEELSSALMCCPTLLGYSLENRIRPRLEQILAAGVEGRKITTVIPLKEEAFNVWLESRLRDVLQRDTDEKIQQGDGELGESEEQTAGKIFEDGGRIIHWRRRLQ